LRESRSYNKKLFFDIARFAIAAIVMFLCFRLSIDAARTGSSRLYSLFAIISSNLDAADSATRLSPGDPEAHYTRGLTLVNLQRLSEAVIELREAVRLRPHHYYEWLDLGVTLDRVGDQQGALAAFQQSVTLAPTFAQPRWQLGNLLFRQGQYEKAFNELRLAVKSDQTLFETMMQLGWAAANEDVPTLEGLLQPGTTEHHLRLARFLARRHQATAAVAQVLAAGEAQSHAEIGILGDVINELIKSKDYSEAHAAWIATHKTVSERDHVLNGDFMSPISQTETGFNWQLPVVANLSAAIDPMGPVANTRSIKLQFSGEVPQAGPLLSQLVLLEPDNRYTLTFMARTLDLVSGAPPVIDVVTAGRDVPATLGHLDRPISNSAAWEPYRIDFTTADKDSAVVISLHRIRCNQTPCPIFGKLWLSEFKINKN
jgi:tetratricopeptide (TPR) repeat protein